MAHALKQIERKADRSASHGDLQQVITRIEARQAGFAPATAAIIRQSRQARQFRQASLGIREIDHALDPANGRGIVTNALHEVRVETGLAAASGAGFALALGLILVRATSAANEAGQHDHAPIPPVFWICDDYTRAEYGGFYGPGLAVFGLTPGDLIRIHPKDRQATLWAAGEIAATPNAAAFCLIEIRHHPREIDLTATRRLMLRARASGTPVILLRQSGGEEASAAATRWCVRPAGSFRKPSPENHDAVRPLQDQFIGPPAFAVTLEKCRGGHANPSTHWTIEWNRDEQCFAPILSASIPSAGNGNNCRTSGKDEKPAQNRRTPLSFGSSAQTRHRQDPAAKTG